MHVGFTSDEGGNTIDLRWYRHKSNLHHVRLLFSSYKFEELDYEKRLPIEENVKVWDREIILTALKEYYDKDLDLLQEDLEKNITNVIHHSLYSTRIFICNRFVTGDLYI